MIANIKRAYAETFEILQLLGDEYINKIPNEFIKFIEKEKDNNYNVNINPDIPLEEQNLLEDTINILAILKLDYWCKNKEEKDELKRILIENENEYQEELRKKYNPDNIFNKHKEQENIKEGNEIISVNKDKWYKKILIFFIKMLKK